MSIKFQKICLITNYNLYETKRNFTKKLSEAMERKGIETLIFDVNQKELDPAAALKIKQFNPDITCSFSAMLPFSPNQFLWDILEIPHLSILVDPSLYRVELTRSPYSIISCVDRFDCEGLLSMGFKKAFFWPHGVDRDLKAPEGGERPYEVVFVGSCFDYESLRNHWREELPKNQCEVLDNAISYVLSDNHTCLHAALVKAWSESNLFPGDADFLLLFYYLDFYTRGKDRVDLIRSIKDAKVHVFGELQQMEPYEQLGWEHYLKGQKNVTLHDSYPFEQSLDILRQAKICLNSNPFFKNGSHERIFNSLACGAVPMTTDNLFVRNQFKEGKDLLLYLNPHLNDVNEKINDLLSNESKRVEMAAKGREKVMKHHTWDSRVEELLLHFPQ